MRYICFCNSAQLAHMEENECFSPLNSLICRQYYFQKLTQVSLGNNVLDAPPSNLGGFLLTDTCVSSIHLNRPILN
jgi:hypothetical protein